MSMTPTGHAERRSKIGQWRVRREILQGRVEFAVYRWNGVLGRVEVRRTKMQTVQTFLTETVAQLEADRLNNTQEV